MENTIHIHSEDRVLFDIAFEILERSVQCHTIEYYECLYVAAISWAQIMGFFDSDENVMIAAQNLENAFDQLIQAIEESQHDTKQSAT